MRFISNFQEHSNILEFNDGIPCESFDDVPAYVTPDLMINKLLAGGQEAEFKLRKTYYDNDDFEDFKEDYACDYIDKYRHLVAEQRVRYKKRYVSSPPSQDDSSKEFFSDSEKTEKTEKSSN